ncbi:MAG: hypothetical protein IKP29_02365, partial [Pseudobutyrivibrio sp.]|nr:hypothetical protein [Pseudobutyrivibrio sp.]
MKKRFLSLLMATTFVGTIAFNNNVAFAAEAQEEVVDDVEAVSEEEIEDTRVIPQGITIQGMDVGGLTVTEANGLIKDYYSKYNDIAFTLSANDKTIEATGKDLCIGAKNKDVAVKAATYGTYGNIGERFKANADIADG